MRRITQRILRRVLSGVPVTKLHVVYSLAVVGFVGAVGWPMVTGMFKTNENSQKCFDLIDSKEQRACFEKEVLPQARANAQYAKAVGNALTGEQPKEEKR